MSLFWDLLKKHLTFQMPLFSLITATAAWACVLSGVLFFGLMLRRGRREWPSEWPRAERFARKGLFSLEATFFLAALTGAQFLSICLCRLS